MADIVIDTCTLVHASNPESNYFEHSVAFIEKMLLNSILCVVDEGFSLDESENKSFIGLEYIEHLQPMSLGYNLIIELLSAGRIDFISNKVPQVKKNYIEQHIRNKKDRLFLRVALNSKDKLLISHDFTDYQKKKRKTIYKDLSLSILTAEEINDNI